jgi:hypothetical protein
MGLNTHLAKSNPIKSIQFGISQSTQFGVSHITSDLMNSYYGFFDKV